MSETLFATTVGYEASPNWHHTLTMGVDQNRLAYEGTSFGDLRAKSSDYQRRTFRYFTNYDTQLSENFSGRFTLGADLVLYDWQEAEGGHDHGEDDDSGHSHNVIEGWRNLGYYGVAEFGFRDRLYLTVAARLEQDLRKVSDRHSRPFQPRAGVSYVFGGDGNTTVKLRAQWGSSARAPTGEPLVAAGNVLPATNLRPEEATNLRPEEKVGWDAGVDIVWASLGSVSITRFDEEGRDLVMPVILNPGSRPQRLQYQNAGLVSNKGWELEARLVLGPVGLRANATMADNQIEALSNYYPPGPYADHVVGARRINVPKHAGGVSATVNAFLGTVSLDANWIGPTRRPFQPVGYVAPSWWRMNLRTEQQINDRLTLFARIDNVLNKQDSETYAFQVAQGRTTVIGLRYTF